MTVNRSIIILVFVLMASGWFRIQVQGKGAPFTPILIGGYVLAIILSLVDLMGGVASDIVTGIAYVAMLSAVLDLAGILPQLTRVFTSQDINPNAQKPTNQRGTS